MVMVMLLKLGQECKMSVDNIRDFEFFPEIETLRVVYGGGSIWDYKPVDKSTFASKDVMFEVKKFLRHTNIVGIKVV